MVLLASGEQQLRIHNEYLNNEVGIKLAFVASRYDIVS
jgi:hypothetical protein